MMPFVRRDVLTWVNENTTNARRAAAARFRCRASVAEADKRVITGESLRAAALCASMELARDRDDDGGSSEMREEDYRERALKLFPWICARCGREFSGRRLRELTVHHKDHDHDNNPPDGSNWELLCLYCHDEEHTKYVGEQRVRGEKQARSGTFRPFADLDKLLKK